MKKYSKFLFEFSYEIATLFIVKNILDRAHILENVDVLSARNATAARRKFLFLNLLIYFILKMGGWSNSDIKSTLPSSKSSYARYYYKWIFTACITRF